MSNPVVCGVCGDIYIVDDNATPTANGMYSYCSPKCANADGDARTMIDDFAGIADLAQGEWDVPQPTVYKQCKKDEKANVGAYNPCTTAEVDEQRIALEIAMSGSTDYDHLSDDEWEDAISVLSGYHTPMDVNERKRRWLNRTAEGKAKRYVVNRRYCGIIGWLRLIE